MCQERSGDAGPTSGSSQRHGAAGVQAGIHRIEIGVFFVLEIQAVILRDPVWNVFAGRGETSADAVLHFVGPLSVKVTAFLQFQLGKLPEFSRLKSIVCERRSRFGVQTPDNLESFGARRHLGHRLSPPLSVGLLQIGPQACRCICLQIF